MPDSSQESTQPAQRSNYGIRVFFGTLILLAVLRVGLQSFEVPRTWVPIANILMTEVFLGGPLLALCYAARDHWTPKTALGFLVGGVALQISCVAITNYIFYGPGTVGETFNAIGQIGLPIWCVGLGALLATLIKEQNMILPIAIFLACLDMFLVFSPFGATQFVLKNMPHVLPMIGAQIPSASSDPNMGTVRPGAYAGPADFMFLAMFLVAIFRFKMRGRLTVMVVVPALLVYMLFVSLKHTSLPALVPIGACVLIVNFTKFKLSKDELISTLVVAAAGIGLVTWGMFQKPKTVTIEPDQTMTGPKARKPLNLPKPAPPDP